MRSKSEQRKHKYSNVREMVEKRAAGFSAPYLKLPEGTTIFKPKKGIFLLDIIPFVAGEGNPWADEGMLHWERTFYIHRGIGANNDSHLCLRKTLNQKCPICDFRQKLSADGDEDKEELIKQLAPKERQLFNVINRKEPDKGIQLWDISYHMFGKLLQARLRDADEDDGWERFFSLEDGLAIKVGFEEKTFGGFTYLEAETIDFKQRSDQYDDDMLEDEKLLVLDDILVETEYDELKKIFLESADDVGKGGKKRREEEEEDEEQEEDEEPKKKRRVAEEDEPEEDEEEEAPKKKKSSKDDDEDDGWDDFDKDEKKGKSKKKDDEEDEESEDEEEEPATKKKGKKSKEEDDFDDLEEDEEEEKPRVKSKDQEDEEDEEEDEEPPKKKKKK